MLYVEAAVASRRIANRIVFPIGGAMMQRREGRA